MRLTTALAFDAAYGILGHPGRCAYLHGHTSHREIAVGAEQVGNPTVELFAREAWQAIGQSLPSGITLERMVIRETPTCAAEISHDA